MLEQLLSIFSVQQLMWLIVLVPLCGFFINGIISLGSFQLGLDEPRPLVIFISQISVIISLFLVIVVAYILSGLEEPIPRISTIPLISWNGFLNKPLEFGLAADLLSTPIVVVAAFTGLLVHIYSVGYLSREKRVAPYFSLLNLVFSLTTLLILTDSFFLFFVVWQVLSVIGVVLISRYFTDEEGIRSARAYYVTEVISGAAFLLVMVLIWKVYLVAPAADIDIFRFTSMDAGAAFLRPYAPVICFALFVSILLRSMQFPLYVWLTGATKMETPFFTFVFCVSSILVSSYLLMRLQLLFYLSQTVLSLMVIVGALGALFGSMSAITQKRMKDVAAYFVISQMGLVFIGVGIKAFELSIFHVLTYAVYMTTIMFGVGSISATMGSDSLDELSGLRRYLPVTFWTMLVGTFAACGIYPLSGFFSKMGFLWQIYQGESGILFLAVLLSYIFCTIALFRMVSIAFFGPADRERLRGGRVSELSVSMLVSMVIVAFASIVAGWFGVSSAFGGENYVMEWLGPLLLDGAPPAAGGFPEVALAVIVTILVAHAGLVTWIVYVQKRRWPERLAMKFRRINSLLENGFYLNKIYRTIFTRPLLCASEWALWKGLDRTMVDGVIVGGIGRVIELGSEIIAKARAKEAEAYVFLSIAVLVVVIGLLVF